MGVSLYTSSGQTSHDTREALSFRPRLCCCFGLHDSEDVQKAAGPVSNFWFETKGLRSYRQLNPLTEFSGPVSPLALSPLFVSL
jgi:hypothetical protein